ncbi:MAG: hypothetical protein L0Z73_03610 [Gammaproteobacteria bacterium]|nr:hypothetical protein [Gammaproteobacteria bacterium]
MTVLKQILLLLACIWFSTAPFASDRREYQHGVQFIPLPGGGYWLLWSSSPGDPPQGDQQAILKDGGKCEYFTHDIYFSRIDSVSPVINKNPLIVLPEAQEPVSAAISRDGVVAVTFEDGSENNIVNCEGNIQQRYQLFDKSLRPISKMKKVAINGAHSGHIAAVNNHFVLAYAEGWIDGGGFEDSGSANDIYVDVIDAQGQRIHHRGIAVDKGSPRDWWPLVAGSDKHAMLVWQRFVNDSGYANLMFAVYAPYSNTLIKEITLLKANLVYYHYDVQYLPAINRFLIVGNYVGDSLLHRLNRAFSIVSPKMFAYLLDEQGNIVAQWDANPDCEGCRSYLNYLVVRESQPAVYEDQDNAVVKVLYPGKPKGVIALAVTESRIELQDRLDGDHYWFPLGADGIFLDENTAYFANLTQQGLKTFTLKLK